MWWEKVERNNKMADEYGSGGKITFRQLGKKYGITASTVARAVYVANKKRAAKTADSAQPSTNSAMDVIQALRDIRTILNDNRTSTIGRISNIVEKVLEQHQ